jgi:superfamily II DNA or RNA helicase
VTLTNFPAIDLLDLRHQVGKLTFDQGAAVARSGRVAQRTMVFNPTENRLVGKVRGRRPQPYETHVWLQYLPGTDLATLESGYCTCPTEFFCKHMISLILVATTFSGQARARSDWRELKPWEKALVKLSGADSEAAAHRRLDRVALQFRLFNERFLIRAARCSAHGLWTAHPELSPAMRPGVIVATVSRGQQRWFESLWGLLTPGGRAAQWTDLQRIESDYLWTLLKRAEDLGIELIAEKPGDVMELARLIELAVDIRQQDPPAKAPAASAGEPPAAPPDGATGAATAGAQGTRPRSNLMLSAVLRIGGEGGLAPPKVRGTPVGESGWVLAWSTAQQTRIVAGPGSGVSRETEAALIGALPQVIPEADADRFWSDYYPELTRSFPVVSSDNSVELPAVVTPVLVLHLSAGRRRAACPVSARLAWRWRYGPDKHGVEYAPGSVPAVAAGFLRNRAAEAAILNRVEAIQRTTKTFTGPADAVKSVLEGMAVVRFAANGLPELRALKGLDVVGELPATPELLDPPEIRLHAADPDLDDWVDLTGVVTVGQEEVSFQELFKALASGEDQLLTMNGSLISLNHPVFERLAELIAEARTLSDKEGLRISRYHASLWGDLEELATHVAGAEQWRRAMGRLRELAAGDQLPQVEELPAGLTAQLRPYQQAGYDWLVFLWRHGLGGILADDMGLGKTLQTLTLVARARQEAGPDSPPFLVVAPSSVASGWLEEAARFTPALKVVAATATRARDGVPLTQLRAGADLVVTSYAVFRLDIGLFEQVPWAGLILDEAQFAKNPKSQANRLARRFKAPFKLAVTGTPLENSLDELWAIFMMVAPGLLGRRAQFRALYGAAAARPTAGRGAAGRSAAGGSAAWDDAANGQADGIGGGGVGGQRSGGWHDAANGQADGIGGGGVGGQRGGGWDGVGGPADGIGGGGVGGQRGGIGGRESALRRLRRRVKPLLMRRTKELVAPELPERQEQVFHVKLDPEHRRAYDTRLQRERQRILGLLGDYEANQFALLRSLTILRRAALDMSLVDETAGDIPSSKLTVLLDQLTQVVAAGHRALVFSQFTSYLAKVKERLDAAGTAYAYLDGSTRNRAAVIADFKNGTAPVFLISLKAGGFGLNLTEADYVYLLDPWWNPATENQAIDRTHRIGQDRPVMVVRLVSEDTIEDKVMALKTRKQALFDSVFDQDGGFGATITQDDVRSLIDP